MVMDTLLKSTLAVLFTIILILTSMIISVEVETQFTSKAAIDQRVHAIYNEIVAASGESNDYLPLFIVEDDVYNAYTDGEKIVIYRGLIDKASWDGIALTLGHELAHYHLGHTRVNALTNTTLRSQQAEALADKVGAFYMMRAGYDLCRARQEWKRLRDNEGDYLGGDHPTYGYRYDALNINCGR